MDFPHAHRATARPAPMGLPTPQIYVHDSNSSDRFRGSSRSSSYHSSILSPTTSSIPMSIPNSREPGPPPPLPPPKHLQDIVDGGRSGPDLAWKFGNSHEYSDWSGSVSSVATGSSLYGNFLERRKDERAGGSPMRSHAFKENSYPRSDEGYVSQSGTSIGSNFSRYQESISPAAGFQSSVHDKYRSNNAQAYDKSLLQKLDARRGTDNSTPPSYSKPRYSSSANDTSPTSRRALEHRHPSQLKPLSLPILTGRPSLAESPLSRWAGADTPISGTSPGGNSYYKFGPQSSFDHRSPIESDRSPLPYIKRSGSGSAPDDSSSITSKSREGHDQRVSPDHDIDFHMEDNGFTRLQIDDYSTRHDAYSPGAMIGQKRRASSPPGDDGPSLHNVGSASDLFRRRESASRSCPSPRFHSTSGSVSSTASGPRNSSYASSLSVADRSSSTSAGSYGKLSPGSVSPGNMDMMEAPYSTNHSPGASVSKTHHQRTVSETRPLLTSRKMSDSTSQIKHKTKLQGVFMCECCPKKPKKFDSQEELNVHEQEKQYQCAYCCNRFKNKNEAERHQNSLHLRRHSWSCAALSGYAAAFHSSPNRPNEADSCGYCGEDFPRSGISSPSVLGPPMAVATDQDWEMRIGHLQEMHKFGECNHAKKFFRADHFRQHLKHSHAGTSGKWTNMLENACMKDEPLPEPIRGPERVSPGGIRVARINEEEEMM